MVAPMTRRQMCKSVTMCNGSKSHKPFSINNCNGVTGVPHLTGMPPMTRMGISERGPGSYLRCPIHPCHPCHPGSNRQAGGIPPGQEWFPRHPPHLAKTRGSRRPPLVPKTKQKRPCLFWPPAGGGGARAVEKGKPSTGSSWTGIPWRFGGRSPPGLPTGVPMNKASQRGSVLPGLELAPTHHDGARFIIFPLPFAGFVSSSPDNAKGRGRCNRGGAGSV